MLVYLRKTLYILGASKQKLIFILFIFILTAFLEATGIGAIAPFFKLAFEPELIYKNELLNSIYRQLNLQNSGQFLLLLGLVIIILFCLKSLFFFLGRMYAFQFSYKQKEILVNKLLSSYLTVPYTFHLNKNSANIIHNIIVETNQFIQQCLLQMLFGVSHIIIIGIILALLAKVDLLLLVLIMAILLPIFILFNRLGGTFKKWGRITSESQTEMIRILNHSLGGLKETRVIGCENYFQEQMAQEAKQYSHAASLFQTLQLLPRIFIETILIAFLILFVAVSQAVFQQNIQDLTVVMSVYAVASIRLITYTSSTLQIVNVLRNSSHILNMLYNDLREIEKQKKLQRTENSRLTSSNNQKTIKFVDQIDIKNIAYQYPNSSEKAIENISLTIKKGESIAFIGKSGAGKTTIVDIILGLLEPQIGDIYADGVSVYENLRSWQNLVGYIPQSIFITDETIARNIAFGVPDREIDPKRLQQAIEAAQLTDLIRELPEGIETKVGERGVRLSGGQRQRIGIARAIYHQREILVLDEATSALDNETENLVSESIRSLAGKQTLIIIAHRLSTVEHCDRIYKMEKGCLVDSGSYQEVVLGS